MHCEQVRNLLNDYVESSLSGALRERVQAHLDACAECRRELRFVQCIWRGLSALPDAPTPADLHGRIMTHVRAHARAKEAQGRVLLWRWMGAAAAAASLFLLGFFAAQSDGVQATFGLGKVRQPAVQTPQLVQAGVFIEYREAEDGTRLPVLLARLNREATAELRYAPSAEQEPALVWRGALLPGKTVEIPLQALLQASNERALTLWWRVEGQRRVLFVPAGYPPAKLATLQLQAKLGEALRQLAAAYQTPIEWVPNGAEPLVVLDVQDATLEDALRQLLVGSNYTLKRQGELWRVVSR